MNQYQKDYEISRKKEIEFEAYLKIKYSSSTENSSTLGYFPFWDISSTATTQYNNKITKFEVKYNGDYTIKYNEDVVVIEACRYVDQCLLPAGLTLTLADYYVLCFENDSNWYAIKVDKLKELVANFKKIKKRIVYDRNGYQLQIFDKAFLLQFCKII